MSSMHMSGPPYASPNASPGGVPTTTLDAPILSVLLLFYIAGAAGNMALFRMSKRRGTPFKIYLPLFGFCMARITTCVVRIVWSVYPQNVRLGIAATIFVNAGIAIIYAVNVVFARRTLRAVFPSLSTGKSLRKSILDLSVQAFIAWIVAAIIMVITAIVISFYTLNVQRLHATHDVQLTAITMIFVSAVVPFLTSVSILVYLMTSGKSRSAKPYTEESKHDANIAIAGSFSPTKKALVLLVGSTLATIIAGFGFGSAWEPARPRTMPAWFDSKAAFYCFHFMLEIFIVAFYIGVRVDKVYGASPKPKEEESSISS